MGENDQDPYAGQDGTAVTATVTGERERPLEFGSLAVAGALACWLRAVGFGLKQLRGAPLHSCVC